MVSVVLHLKDRHRNNSSFLCSGHWCTIHPLVLFKQKKQVWGLFGDLATSNNWARTCFKRWTFCTLATLFMLSVCGISSRRPREGAETLKCCFYVRSCEPSSTWTRTSISHVTGARSKGSFFLTLAIPGDSSLHVLSPSRDSKRCFWGRWRDRRGPRDLFWALWRSRLVSGSLRARIAWARGGRRETAWPRCSCRNCSARKQRPPPGAQESARQTRRIGKVRKYEESGVQVEIVRLRFSVMLLSYQHAPFLVRVLAINAITCMTVITTALRVKWFYTIIMRYALWECSFAE